MPENRRPYLSVVVTARNDDHGGNLLGRMQAFVNALIGQARRHGLPMELIVVEWNPPLGKPSLAAALRWPREFGPCTVRILGVPPEVHRRYKHAEGLPLYQMTAKNVGIRRARGRFVLATNIDILFSDELSEFLAQRRLESGKLYRIDRHDVMGDVPAEAPVEEQLSYCRSHLLRVNAREGTFPLTREGLRGLFERDIAVPGSGVCFGRGWYPVEQHSGQVFRWVGQEAELMVAPPHAGACVLCLDLEPGPGVARKPFRMGVLDGTGKVLAEVWVRGRSLLRLRLGSPARQSLWLRVPDGGLRVRQDPRVLNFRAFGCAWHKGGPHPGTTDVEVRLRRGWHLAGYPVAAWEVARRAGRFLLRRDRSSSSTGVAGLAGTASGRRWAVGRQRVQAQARRPAGSGAPAHQRLRRLHADGPGALV